MRGKEYLNDTKFCSRVGSEIILYISHSTFMLMHAHNEGALLRPALAVLCK